MSSFTHISSTVTSDGDRETARTDLAGNCLRHGHQKFPLSVFKIEGIGLQNFFFLLVQGPVATGNDQIYFVLMDKEASNYAFPRHAVSMHPVPLLVMHVVGLLCVKLPNFDRVPEIRQFLSLVTFCNSLNKAGTLYPLSTDYCFTQQ